MGIQHMALHIGKTISLTIWHHCSSAWISCYTALQLRIYFPVRCLSNQQCESTEGYIYIYKKLAQMSKQITTVSYLF